MKQTQLIMGMPISVEITDAQTNQPFDKVFAYFKEIDNRYSTYKPGSEISRINTGLTKDQWSAETVAVLQLCEETKRLSDGYFDISKHGYIDPSGLVKGWAINNAADMLKTMGYSNFYIEAGGDIQVAGSNGYGRRWRVGIRNPFNISQIIKIIEVTDVGIATSGTYIRGEHIYNPKDGYSHPSGIKSLTVIAPNVYEADRFATSAFAMGRSGMNFIRALPSFEGYLIDEARMATYTEGFERYVA